MTTDDIKQIGDEMVRLLEPVYESLDTMNKKFDEHTGKIDALLVDVKQIQDEMGALRDDLGNKEQKHLEEHNKIRAHVGMAELTTQAT